MSKRILRPRFVKSPFGWPVPRGVRVASAGEIRSLAAEAQVRGFSRRGGDLSEAVPGCKYVLCALLPEENPEKCWICMVLKYPDRADGPWRGSLAAEGRRLDVRRKVYKKLSVLSDIEKDQLLVDLMWSS